MLTWFAAPAWAGLSVYTSWSSLPPTTSANQRVIDFNNATLDTEKAAGKLTYTQSIGASTSIFNSGGAISYTSSSSLNGFSQNVGTLTSGTTGNSTSVTINFTKPTPYVGFLWGVEFNAENSMQVNLTLEDNSVVTLQNCSSASNNLCIAKYVSSNWFANIYNTLLGWLFGQAVQYYPIYMQYEPDTGQKIVSMQILVKNCAGCGSFLAPNSSQNLQFDYLVYVDASVAPHHLELTSPAATTTVNASTNFTVKACGDVSCSTPYTSGVKGSLSISGVSASTNPVSFVIAPGPTNSVTVPVTMTSAGTATIGLSTTAPASTPAVYCGMGVSAASNNSCTIAVVAASPHHLELTTSTTSTLTCQPINFTIKACADSGCSSLYTSGVSGTLSVGGSSTGFNIASGSSSTSLSIYAGTAGTATAALSGFSVTPSNGVYCGINTGAASNGNCNISVTSSGFVMSVADHFSEPTIPPVMTVQALSATSNPTVCSPTFNNGAVKQVTFKCSYTNPSTGILPVRIGTTALNASGNSAAVCDGTGKAVSLVFGGINGVATTTFQYADAGQVLLTANYTGSDSEPGLNISGTKSVIVAPASFAISGVTTGPLKAGSAFGATVTAKNLQGATTANFGKESPAAGVTMSFTRAQPTGTGASNGTFTGSVGPFSSGVASSTNLVWSEVGKGDVVATLSGGNYLNSTTALVPTGSTGSSGAVGLFIPDHFKVETTNACKDFSFNGQPFKIKVTAQNASNGTTVNYDGSLSSSTIMSGVTYNQPVAVGLSVISNSASVAGNLKSNSIAATAFTAGVADLSANGFDYTTKQSPPTTIGLRASASLATVTVTSAGANDASMALRSGRLKISNVFGSEKQSLDMTVLSQYWSGSAWIANALDVCSVIPASAVVLSGYRDNKGQATTPWATTVTPYPPTPSTPNPPSPSRTTKLTFSAPNPVATGSVDVALNLGDPNLADQSCLSTHGGTGAALPWMRSQNGNCASTFDRDPSARVTFGIYTPESNKTIHVREVY